MIDKKRPSAAPKWPTGRNSRTGVLAQFGGGRADLVGSALVTGDPLADAVVDEIHAGGPAVRVKLQHGIEHGLAKVDSPPPGVAALLRHTEAAPAYVDNALLDEAPLPFFSAPVPVHIISLAAGALVRTYQSPSIATVLAMTGRLIDGVPRRIAETGRWVATAMLPGSLRPGNIGYIATLQVRMMHAHMRRLARNRGYDEAAYGVPINQVDLVRTWMDFTLISYRAEETMGFGLTSVELASLYRYWWHIGHLLGIDARLIEGITSHEDAQRVDDLMQAVTGPIIAETGKLAAATLEAIADTLHEVVHIPNGMARVALHVLARRFHGHAVLDELGLPRAAAADALLTPAFQAVRVRRARARRDPSAWRKTQQTNIEATRQRTGTTEQPPAYEHATRPELELN
ncbi:oxygenase MpaB family protein [Microtetraspora malaysiensis]|uniref:oxygenase MpaB family protein n=1 Tax=Microtetraspora malaysiensis TaxID=161358 RepID=UPI00082C7DDF|nr:oxygenase MpaB family protein [Microtetraspora malaysiensis]